MNAHSSKPTGRRGCQISMVAQRNACRNLARFVRIARGSGRRVNLCARHEERFGKLVGELATEDRTIIVGTKGAIETIITDFQRPK